MTLKLFNYEYDIPYGRGQGVILAKTKKEANELLHYAPYSPVINLELTEIDLSESQIIDHSWSE